MKKILLLLFTGFLVHNVSAQKIKGQWKGIFIDKSTSRPNWGGDECEYVLELELVGTTISGYSYTYFTEGGKRFYTICKVKGYFNPKLKYAEIKETERTKTNVPTEIGNCLQIHKLNYSAGKDGETLKGNWVPQPKQKGDCGFGVTELTRRTLQNNFPGFNTGVAKNIPPTKNKIIPHKTITKVPTHSIAKNNKKLPVKPGKVLKPVDVAVLKPESEIIKPTVSEVVVSTPPPAEYRKRNFNILKTFEVNNDIIKVDLYDNGEIDGDSISLVYNGRLILNNKKLSDKPITVKLNVDTESDINELMMFAENLGTIPPNTALMIVTDGNNRYEVRITSDLEKSGVIRFVHKVK